MKIKKSKMCCECIKMDVKQETLSVCMETTG